MAGEEDERGVSIWQPFEIFERLDDQQIVRELRGESLKNYVYRFKGADGKTVTGLSKKGVDAAVSHLAQKGTVIRELDVSTAWDEEAVYITIKAGRYAVSTDGREVLLDTTFGAKRQPKKMVVYERDRFGRPVQGKTKLVEDPFFFEKAVAKAARNAKRRLIPEDLVAAVISESLGKSGRVREITKGDGAEETTESQSPEETPEAPQTEKPEDKAQEPVQPATETPPQTPQDITPGELSAEAKKLGYTDKSQVFTTLHVNNLKEWKSVATTNTPLREALEVLKRAKAETPAEDIDL